MLYWVRIVTINGTLVSSSSTTIEFDIAPTMTANGGNISLQDIIVDHQFTTYIASGTIGTRGAQLTIPVDYAADHLKSITITSIGNSAEYLPVVFLNGNTIYCNFYRTSTTASNAVCMARIVYSA